VDIQFVLIRQRADGAKFIRSINCANFRCLSKAQSFGLGIMNIGALSDQMLNAFRRQLSVFALP